MKIHTYKLEEQDRYVDFRSYIGGVYFGDPCYVVPGWDDDVWDQLCDKMFTPVNRKHPDTGEEYTSRVGTGTRWEPMIPDINYKENAKGDSQSPDCILCSEENVKVEL